MLKSLAPEFLGGLPDTAEAGEGGAFVFERSLLRWVGGSQDETLGDIPVTRDPRIQAKAASEKSDASVLVGDFFHPDGTVPPNKPTGAAVLAAPLAGVAHLPLDGFSRLTHGPDAAHRADLGVYPVPPDADGLGCGAGRRRFESK